MHLQDRLIREDFEGDELAYIKANIGFDVLSLAQAKTALKAARKHRGCDLDGLIDELETILDDLEFAADPRNDIVRWVGKHHARLEAEVNQRFEVDGLMIRAHVEKTHLCVMGTTAADRDSIKRFIEEQSGFSCQWMTS